MKTVFKKSWQIIKKMSDSELAAVLALMHTGLSHFYSAWFFEYDLDSDIAKRNRLLVGILFFVGMYLVYRGIFWLARHRREYGAYIKCGVIYFALLMVFLLLVWPGIWRGDEMDTAMFAKRYILDGWQHALTSLIYMLSFRLLPIFASVIIVQCAIIAAITSYIYNAIIKRLKNKKVLYKIILWIPFLLPPVIDSALYPLRPILYSYVLVLLICIMVECVLEQRISKLQAVFLVVLLIVGASWRSEGVYILMMTIAYFWYLARRKMINWKWAVVAIVTVFGGWWLIRSFENTALNTWHQNSYKVSATIEVAVPLARRAYNEGGNEAELEAIDRLVDLEFAMLHDDWSGESIYWSEGMRNDYTGQEILDYMKAVIKLGLKYPDEVVSNRFEEFAVTSALVDDRSNMIWDTTSNYDEETWRQRILDFRALGGRLMQPWNAKLRSAVIRILEGRNVDDYNDTIPTYPIFWNLLIPMLAILIVVIILFVKKKWAVGLIIGSLFIKSAIVFVTAPGVYHMYYFAEYLLGYILLATVVVYVMSKRKQLSDGKD